MASKYRAFIATEWDENGNALICLDQPSEGGIGWTNLSEQPPEALAKGIDGVMDNLTLDQLNTLKLSANGKVIYSEEYDDETNEIIASDKEKKYTKKQMSDLKVELKKSGKVELGDETKITEALTPEELIKTLRNEWKLQGETKRMEKDFEEGKIVVVEGRLN